MVHVLNCDLQVSVVCFNGTNYFQEKSQETTRAFVEGVSSGLERMIDSALHSDLLLTTRDGDVRAHKVLIALRFPALSKV